MRLTFSLAGAAHTVHGVVIRESNDSVTSELGVAFAGEQPEAIDLLARSIHELTAAAG